MLLSPGSDVRAPQPPPDVLGTAVRTGSGLGSGVGAGGSGLGAGGSLRGAGAGGGSLRGSGFGACTGAGSKRCACSGASLPPPPPRGTAVRPVDVPLLLPDDDPVEDEPDDDP